MEISRLSKRIELLRPILSDDGYGGQSTHYEGTGKLWAQLKQTNYGEQQAQGTPMNREELRFVIRPRKGIQRGWRLMFEKEMYLITTVDDTAKDCTTIIARRFEQGV